MKSVLEFEEKYKEILENIEEWAYIRLSVGFYLKNKSNEKYKNNEKYTSNRKKFFKEKFKKLLKIKDIFYGFKNWFGKYEYLFFSNSLERRMIENKYKNKLLEDIIDSSKKKSLLIELIVSNENYEKVYTKYIVSDGLIVLLNRIISFFIMKLSKNIDIMKNLLSKESINVNLKKELKNKRSLEIIYKILLKIYKPKKVFVTCYYCRLPLVKACHELNIPVVDVQHGVINSEHFGYVSNIKIDKKYIADELLSFGENEKKIKNLMIKKVYPIGSYYLTYLKDNFKSNEKILELKENFQYCIGVSMQDQEWEYISMINFVNKLAKKYKNILFLIIPRRKKDYFNLIKENNIKVISFLDCYNTIMHCDIHMTLYSSCALEAPTLGIPNILVDVNNMATKYYKNLLSNHHTKIIIDEKGFYHSLKELSKLNSDEIKSLNQNVFIENYKERVFNYFKELN